MPWPMKTERDVIQLARGELTVDKIAARLKIGPKTVIKIGKRMGIYFAPVKPKRKVNPKTK